MHKLHVKILSKDRGWEVGGRWAHASGDALCLHFLWDLYSRGCRTHTHTHTHITAEIAVLGWKQIIKGPWIPHQSK